MRLVRGPLLAAVALSLIVPHHAAAQQAPRAIPELHDGERYRVEALARYWRPVADIVVSSDRAGIPGTRIDLKSDLGLVDQGMPELQVVLRPGRKHKVRFTYLPISFDATGAPRRDLVFDAATYPAHLPVTSRLEWHTYRFGYEYDFLIKPWGFVGLVADAKHTVVEMRLRSPSGDRVSRQAMPIPEVGGIVRVYPFRRLALTGEMTFFGVPDSDDLHYGAHVADIDVHATWNVMRHLGVQAGFRDIDIDHLGEWNTATFVLKGVQVGVVARF